MITFLENEKIIVEERRHWFVIATEALFLFFIAVAPPATIFIFGDLVPEISQLVPQHKTLEIFLTAAWWQIVWMSFFVFWTNYYLDVLVVTNRRVMDIEQLGLFARDMAELRLENIQDIKVEVVGILPSLLNMGNLHIQTAGEAREMVIKNIPYPDRIKDAIAQQRDLISSIGKS